MKKSRAALIIGLCCIVLVLHAAGIFLEFYWRISWYNLVVHTLAGATAALGIISFTAVQSLLRRPIVLFFGAILISLIIGVLWELFEVKAGVELMSSPGYALYTAGDIISDVVGGILAGGYVLLFR